MCEEGEVLQGIGPTGTKTCVPGSSSITTDIQIVCDSWESGRPTDLTINGRGSGKSSTECSTSCTDDFKNNYDLKSGDIFYCARHTNGDCHGTTIDSEYASNGSCSGCRSQKCTVVGGTGVSLEDMMCEDGEYLQGIGEDGEKVCKTAYVPPEALKISCDGWSNSTVHGVSRVNDGHGDQSNGNCLSTCIQHKKDNFDLAPGDTFLCDAHSNNSCHKITSLGGYLSPGGSCSGCRATTCTVSLK